MKYDKSRNIDEIQVSKEEVILTGPIVVGDVPEVEYKTETAESRSMKSNNQRWVRFTRRKKRGLKN